MTPSDDHPHAQRESERAALGGDVASQALNEALRVSFLLLKLAMGLGVVLFFAFGIFTVKQGEQAFILRLGQIVSRTDPATGKETALLGPGIHFAWPFLIDEVVRFPVEEARKLRVDAFWYFDEKDNPTGQPPRGIAPGRGGYTLTGDTNILHSKWTIRYRLSDPVRFFQSLDDPVALAENPILDTYEALLSALLRNAVIRTIAHFKVDDAYLKGKEHLRAEVLEGLAAEVRHLDVGIQVADVLLDAIVPPRQAKQAFDSVAEAEQKKSALIHGAESYYNETINQAKGQASRDVAEALTYKTRVQHQAAADAKYIRDLLQEYPNQPRMLDLFLQQRLVEVIQETFEASDERFVLSEPDGTSHPEVRIQINRDPKRIREIIRRNQEREKARKASEK